MGHLRRETFKNSGHSKSFGAAKANTEKFQIKPKIIAILRSGLKPRKAVRVLLNNRNTKTFETLLADLTNTVKLDTGAVRKVFTLDGKPVMTQQDFTEAEVFIAYGVDKCTNDDFDLDIIEFRYFLHRHLAFYNTPMHMEFVHLTYFILFTWYVH